MTGIEMVKSARKDVVQLQSALTAVVGIRLSAVQP